MLITPSPSGIAFIKKWEFFVPHFYLDDVGAGLIGYGSTRYQNGNRPKEGDTITEPDAAILLHWTVNIFSKGMTGYILNPLNQNQQDSLISLTYNIGISRFVKSEVLRLLNQNQHDPKIKDAFMTLDKATVNGKLVILPGLTKRRAAEAEMYFS